MKETFLVKKKLKLNYKSVVVVGGVLTSNGNIEVGMHVEIDKKSYQIISIELIDANNEVPLIGLIFDKEIGNLIWDKIMVGDELKIGV